MDTLQALTSLLALDRLPRTGWLLAGIEDPETIAGHVVSTAHVVLALGPEVSPALDVDRAIALAVVHDSAEAWTGDIPRAASREFAPGAKQALEAQVADELIGALSAGARERFGEYAAGSSREARFARVCDRLQLGVQLLAYRRAGRGELDGFVEGFVGLDCGEFEAARGLHGEILRALAEADTGRGCGRLEPGTTA